MSKVFIYSIPRETATRVSAWENPSSGKKMKKTKIGECTDKISALYSPRVGGLANYISYTPWIENGERVKDSEGNELFLQQREEKKWGLPEGYLTNRAWRRGDSMRDEDLTYFQKTSWILKDGATILDLDNFDDAMFYYVCLASSRVANSEKDWRDHKFPHATHYIALENESEELEYAKKERKSRAFAKLHDPNLSLSYKRKISHLLALSRVTVNTTDAQIHNLLYEYINADTQLNGNVDRFMKYADMLSTASGREAFEAEYTLLEGVAKRVLSEYQGAYIWTRSDGPIELGSTKSEAIMFLVNPKKKALVKELRKLISMKK